MRSVSFPGLDSLVGLSRHGADVKPALLRVLTDLYVQKPTHSQAEESQYIELALRLIDAVDVPTRAAVARQLATYPNAPRAVLNRLAGELPPPADQTNSENCTAANHDEASALPNSEKIKAAAAALTDRFFAADGHERLQLLTALDAQGPLELATAPAQLAEISQKLEASALTGRPSEFIRTLERALGVTRTMAEMIVDDSSGEPLLVAAKALSIPIGVLQRILLFVNPSIRRSVRRVYALIALYDTIKCAGALRLVAAWRLAAPGEKRGPLPSHDAQSPHTNAAIATSGNAVPRSAASGPSRRSENFVTRNRDSAEPAWAPRAPSTHDPIKKMTP